MAGYIFQKAPGYGIPARSDIEEAQCRRSHPYGLIHGGRRWRCCVERKIKREDNVEQ